MFNIDKKEKKKIREEKRAIREFKRDEREKRKKLKSLSSQISINKDLSLDLEHSYKIPDELIVDKNISPGQYVIIATNESTEKIAIFKENFDDKYGYVFLENCGVYLFPYYQMRKFIKGHDRANKYFKTTEVLLNKFNNSIYKIFLYNSKKVK